jgi:hypothetical protein
VKEVIYLAVSRQGVSKMTKNLPALARGEVPVKLILDVSDAAFGPPVLEQHVTVTDWRGGIDIADVEFREAVITEAEAEVIRARRLNAMLSTLEGHGYTVTPPAGDDG